ncbi:MAG: 3-dehydroquinate synthase [Peptococcaceae bacterium BRH_c8a]|nr:MAG: 3-dehydroquinate synthase [Peptococcaceae bacterium BRH_c8a]
MREVIINLGQRSYRIAIGSGILDQAGELLARLPVGKKVLLVTNPVVGGLYGARVADSLSRSGFKVYQAEIPDGEQYKSLQSAELLYNQAFEAELDRNCPVVALGGGVVGDLAGFVAATYMRGVPFVQIPTTLLAQVDSSVGGKVAVNHPRGKNIIGSFYQPVLVLTDTATLHTLQQREIGSGLAEVIKYGVIKDREFFTWLEQNMGRVRALEHEALAHVVETSCRVKAAVVEEDETEQGTRAILNLGHTLGHAVETLTGYNEYRHGEAVAIGTAMAAHLAVNLGLLHRNVEQRIGLLLESAGLPLGVPAGLDNDALVKAMSMDKKSYGGEITFVLPGDVGQVVIKKNVARADIVRAIAECQG